jgi:hypothetical protein
MKLRDRVSIPNLLDLAKIPSVNAMVVKAVALDAWSYNCSTDGKDGAMIHVGSIIFDKTRSEDEQKDESGHVRPGCDPTKGEQHLHRTCGKRVETAEDLCSADSKTAARRAAVDLAKLSPLLG